MTGAVSKETEETKNPQIHGEDFLTLKFNGEMAGNTDRDRWLWPDTQAMISRQLASVIAVILLLTNRFHPCCFA